MKLPFNLIKEREYLKMVDGLTLLQLLLNKY
jgi:hypothetical protein